jgi:hypothetical protein
VPLLHFGSAHDPIVPRPRAQPLMERVGSTDQVEVILPGGQVSLVAGANAFERMWPALDGWLRGRST